jgi:hypothetical protein
VNRLRSLKKVTGADVGIAFRRAHEHGRKDNEYPALSLAIEARAPSMGKLRSNSMTWK